MTNYAKVLDPHGSNDNDVAGYCPMGCGQTLFAASGGYITCSLIGCPNPTAVADILEDRETYHIVELGEESFTVRHPLRERLNDAMLECDLGEYLANLDGPPRMPGRYRVHDREDGSWSFGPVSE